MQFKVSSNGAGFSPGGRRLAIIDSSDITLASNDGGHFPAQQSVLAAASPLFVFSSEEASATALTRHLNLSGRSIYWMLDLIYDGVVDIPLQDFLQFKREASDYQLRGVTWVGPKEVPVHVPNSLGNLFPHLLNQVQVQEPNQEEEEEEEQQQAQEEVEEGVPEDDWDSPEDQEEEDEEQEEQHEEEAQVQDEEGVQDFDWDFPHEEEQHVEEAQVQVEEGSQEAYWDFPEEEEEEQHEEEDEDQQAQDNANVETWSLLMFYMADSTMNLRLDSMTEKGKINVP